MDIISITYTDILKLEPTFISLDISINSTGWVRSINGEIEYGTQSLLSEDELGRRREFRSFLKDLLGAKEWPVVFVEDTIGGTNYETTKGLIQLNSIIDDIAADGLVNVGEIKRVDNNHWKRFLKMASNYTPLILKENPKVSIQNCMHLLGFNADVKQDIYDALGMAVAITFRDKVLGQVKETPKALKMDLKRGYDIKAYPTSEDREKGLEKVKKKLAVEREVEYLDWSEETRDVLYLFKKKIKADNRDDKIYLIKEQSVKLGMLALTKKLDTNTQIVYLLITKKK